MESRKIAVRVVRRIFALAVKGVGCKEIAKTLNVERKLPFITTYRYLRLEP